MHLPLLLGLLSPAPAVAADAPDGTRAPGMASAAAAWAPVRDEQVEALRARARGAPDCRGALPSWWSVVDATGGDAEAYEAIARCVGRDAPSPPIEAVVDTAVRTFGESRVLALVPYLLDRARIRDLVPILRQVETRAAGDADGALALGRIYRELGDDEAAEATLRRAVALAPHDGRPLLELASVHVSQGRVAEARPQLRAAVALGGLGILSGAWALAAGWPVPFLVVAGICVGGAGVVARRRDAVNLSQLGAALLVAAGLAGWFGLTAHFTPFLVIALGGALAVAGLAVERLRTPATRIGWRLAARLRPLWNQPVFSRLSRFPLTLQVALAVASVVVLIGGAPMVANRDLQLLVLLCGGLVLFSTLGTLILAFLRRTRSLRSALRWVAGGGAIPFLLFALYLERTALLGPLASGRMPTPETLDRLAAYLGVWSLGLLVALYLARILSISILTPLQRILQSVSAVRAGQFGERISLRRPDEIGALAVAVDEMVEGLEQREAIKRRFRQYVDSVIAERLIAGDAAVTRGRRVRATVLFVDIRGFTTISEGREPEEVVRLLSTWFTTMTPIIRRWGGIVDKFVGDAILAVWGVPETGARDELCAVRAALEMLDALQGLNATLALQGLPLVRIGIGINAGEVIAGPIGTPDRLEYTVIGDTVNTAQRLEGLARGDAPLLVTASVAWRIRHEIPVSRAQTVMLRGRQRPVAIYRVSS